jgi:hypothetical protein
VHKLNKLNIQNFIKNVNTSTCDFRKMFSKYFLNLKTVEGQSWSWLCGSWIYNYLCNQYLSPLTLWVRIRLRRGVFDTTLCDKVCQPLATGRWVTPGTPVSSTNKTPPRYNWNIVESSVKRHNQPKPVDKKLSNYH